MFMLTWGVQCILVMLTVAFFTLFERKVMGLFHLRLGPNKVSILGLIQPLLDAGKLLSKENLKLACTSGSAFNLAPLAALSISLVLWITLPLCFLAIRLSYSLLLFLLISSLSVLPVLVAGWASNSKYSLMGSLRSIAQSISYESVFSTGLVLVMLLLSSFSASSSMSLPLFILLPIFPIYAICVMAETHRAPFDFSEAESELVSGFNTEYSGASFALVFLSEYSALLVSCVLMVALFSGLTGLLAVVGAMALSYLFTWIRVTFCRFRYDLLMSFSWKVLLPSILFISTILTILCLW